MYIRALIDSNLFKSRIIAEVHINSTSQNHAEMNVLVVKRDQQNLDIVRTHRKLNSLEEFSDCVPAGIPLSLIIDGKGIIQKAVKQREDVQGISQVLPNARHQEFIWQETSPGREGLVQISVARKKLVEGWIKKFASLGYMVLDVSIGPLVLAHITPLLPEDGGEMRVKNYKIEYDDSGILEISKNGIDEESYKIRIGTEEIPNVDLIPFAAGLKYFKDSTLSSDNLSEICRTSREQFTFKRIYRVMLFLSASLLFGILLVNFLLFEFYSKQYDRYRDEYTVNRELLDRLTSLEEELVQQQAFFKDNTARGFTRYAYYADRLAYLLPPGITLTELSLDPVPDHIKQDREIQSTEGLIVISGETDQSLQLNRYINEVEKEGWVEDVNLLEYQSDVNDKGKFTIEVIHKKTAR